MKLSTFLIMAVLVVATNIYFLSKEPSQTDIERQVRVACIMEIQKILYDPESMEIVNRVVTKTKNNEWNVMIKIRAKNKIGLNNLMTYFFTVTNEGGEYKAERWRR